MISAIISVLFGALTFLGAPIILPIFGIALGINTHLKERRKEIKNKKALNTATVGIILNICGSIFMIILNIVLLTHKQ